jgi:hypothetical protein
MPPDDKRLEILEQQLHETRREVNTKLDGISTALQSLVRIEERQVYSASQLSELSVDVRDQELRLRQIEVALPKNLDHRLAALELAMPGLKELRKWVVMGVVSGVGMIGAAVVHTVMKG